LTRENNNGVMFSISILLSILLDSSNYTQ
jgi:hypothetical protein